MAQQSLLITLCTTLFFFGTANSASSDLSCGFSPSIAHDVEQMCQDNFLEKIREKPDPRVKQFLEEHCIVIFPGYKADSALASLVNDNFHYGRALVEVGYAHNAMEPNTTKIVYLNLPSEKSPTTNSADFLIQIDEKIKECEGRQMVFMGNSLGANTIMRVLNDTRAPKILGDSLAHVELFTPTIGGSPFADLLSGLDKEKCKTKADPSSCKDYTEAESNSLRIWNGSDPSNGLKTHSKSGSMATKLTLAQANGDGSTAGLLAQRTSNPPISVNQNNLELWEKVHYSTAASNPDSQTPFFRAFTRRFGFKGGDNMVLCEHQVMPGGTHRRHYLNFDHFGRTWINGEYKSCKYGLVNDMLLNSMNVIYSAKTPTPLIKSRPLRGSG